MTPAPDPPRRTLAPAWWLLPAVPFAFLLGAHVLSYFFLFDDFAFVGTARRLAAAEILGTPVGGFFRPAALLVMKGAALVLGFAHPSGYAAVSLLLHALCALLVGVLARRTGAPTGAAAAAGSLFFLSPWAGEAYFWVSSQFELLCAASFLAALLCGIRLAREGDPPARAVATGVLGGAFAGLAFLSKEMAVTLPAAFALLFPWRGAMRRGRVRGAAYVAALLLLLGAYLVLRGRVVPGLGGAYGSLGDLLARGDLARHAASYVRGVALPPPGPASSPAGAASWIHLASLAVLAGVALRRAPLRAARDTAGFFGLLVPVLWSAITAGSTASGRYLYLPGVFVALLLAGTLGAAEGAGRRGVLDRAAPLAASLLLAAALGSVAHQSRLWRAATRLSRETIARLAPYAGRSEHLYVRDLPYVFEEGPYVLKSYALRFYFETDRPLVRADGVTLRLEGGRPVAVRRERDPLSEYAASAGETVVDLGLGPR